MEGSVTAGFASGLASIAVSRFPAEVVSKARDCVIDALGCMLGGSQVAEARIATDFVLGWGGRPEAAVPGLPGLYPAPPAAYAAAQFANTLDFDDEFLGFGHPGGPVIGTALALGQARGASGEEFLRAIVAGYEGAIRIGRATGPTRERQMTVRGHSWAAWGGMAAAGSLLHLSEQQLTDACGLTAQHTLVPFVGKWYERPVPSVKNNYGWAAAGGIIAASIASRKAISNRTVLDGDNGLWAMIGSDQWNPEVLLDGFGTEFSISHISFKPYACVWYMHWALDALERILHEHPVDPGDVRSIVVKAAERLRVYADYRPKTLLHAQSSLPHAIASLMMGMPLTTLNIGDPAVAELADKVRIETDPSADTRTIFSVMPATVEVEMADGRHFSARTEVVPGEPEHPLTREQLRAKYLDLAVPVIGRDKAQALYQAVMDRSGFPAPAALARLYCTEP